MANITSIKIPELAELSQEEFTGAEYLVLDTGTATKKMQVSDFNRASTETATAKANEATQSAQSAAQSALSAQNAAQAATDAIANATSQIAQSVIDVQTAKSDAESSANTARNLVNSDYALTARSYATGDAEDALGHEYREGQSTDNAKYYAEQCEAHDSAAATSETNAKASENNAKASELAAANSAASAAASARQALENATGATVFVGTDGNSAHPTASGLVPAPSAHDGPNALLTSRGNWKEIQELGIATTDNLNTLKTQLQTSFQSGVDTIKNACSTYMEDSYKPSQSTPSAIATAVQNQMQRTLEEPISFFLPTLGAVYPKATFYIPVQRLQSLRIDYCNRELKVNDAVTSAGHTIQNFQMSDSEGPYAVCKVEMYENPNDAYNDPPTFKATAIYSMYETDLPIFDSTQEDNPNHPSYG